MDRLFWTLVKLALPLTPALRKNILVSHLTNSPAASPPSPSFLEYLVLSLPHPSEPEMSQLDTQVMGG